MILLPSETFTLHTRLAPEEVLRRVSEVVEPHRWFRLTIRRRFAGELHGDRFVIRQLTYYHNSHRPSLFGAIIPENGGTCIRVEMKITHKGTIALAWYFLFFDILIATYLCMGLLFAGIVAPLVEDARTLVVELPAAFFGWVTGLGFVGLIFLTQYGYAKVLFQWEANCGRSYLKQLFEAEEPAAGNPHQGEDSPGRASEQRRGAEGRLSPPSPRS